MTASFTVPEYPLVIYTDLDGTLLDHKNYSHAAAQPALNRLRQLGVPVIPVSSKTLSELLVLKETLALRYPLITENGGVIAVPNNYFSDLDVDPQWITTVSGYQVLTMGPCYADILEILQSLRVNNGYKFHGFHDMSVSEVSQLTGLGVDDAGRARQRMCSEPLLWQDSTDTLELFEKQLQGHDLQLTQGGRFWHVMGRYDKGSAILRLNELFRKADMAVFTTIGLGDSPNDIPMLMQVDIAVLVQREHDNTLDLPRKRGVVYTEGVGPVGWNEFMSQYLDNTVTRVLHG